VKIQQGRMRVVEEGFLQAFASTKGFGSALPWAKAKNFFEMGFPSALAGNAHGPLSKADKAAR
jgi:hypothetical protein